MVNVFDREEGSGVGSTAQQIRQARGMDCLVFEERIP